MIGLVFPDSTLVEEGFVRRERARHHTLDLPKRGNFHFCMLCHVSVKTYCTVEKISRATSSEIAIGFWLVLVLVGLIHNIHPLPRQTVRHLAKDCNFADCYWMFRCHFSRSALAWRLKHYHSKIVLRTMCLICHQIFLSTMTPFIFLSYIHLFLTHPIHFSSSYLQL